jgi:D-sedoheptulose 7-phosphate isomerase
MNITMLLVKNLNDSIRASKEILLDHRLQEEFSRATQKIIECYKSGGRLYIAGNGGSAADAQHLAAEFVSKLAKDRPALPAEALTVDSSIITAIGNDYGFDSIFSRQLSGKAGLNDVFLGITTSGKSKNIMKALEHCKLMGIPSIVFTGRDGGEVKQLADYLIIAPGKATSTIQEQHIILAHTLCESVESAIFGSNGQDNK